MGSAAGLSVAFLLLPILALVPMSLSRTTWLAFPPDALTLEWYGRVLADREWREAAWTSLSVAVSGGAVWPASSGLRRASRSAVAAGRRGSAAPSGAWCSCR